MLLKNVQDGISRHLGNRAIQKTKVETDLLDTLYKEFRFSHPTSRLVLNRVYNCQLWNLFSQSAEKFYGTYNRSVSCV